MKGFEPEFYYVSRLDQKCQLTYLDEGCKAYEEKKQEGRELFWANLIDSKLKPNETAVVFVGAGHIERKKMDDPNVCHLTEYLSARKIKTKINHQTFTVEEILRLADDFKRTVLNKPLEDY